MDKPQHVKQAILLIWITLGISVLVALIDKWTGYSSDGEFMFTLIAYGVFCMFPYKLNNKSNATRYVYAVMVALSALTILGGVTAHASQLTVFSSFLMMPVQIFITYQLFQYESSQWFTSRAD